jgi:hypothetical protein
MLEKAQQNMATRMSFLSMDAVSFAIKAQHKQLRRGSPEKRLKAKGRSTSKPGRGAQEELYF